MKEKKNTGLVWLVVILIVLVVALMGFIIFREFYSEEKPNVDNITTTKVNKENGNDKKELTKFPNNDNSVKAYVEINYFKDAVCDEDECKIIDKYKDNKNLKISTDNMNITYNCDDFDYIIPNDDVEPINKFCYKHSLDIDNKIIYKTGDSWELGEESTLIMKTDKYYFIQQVGLEYGNGKITIYDNNGKMLKEIKNTVTDFTLDEDSEYTDVDYKNYSFKLNDSKLYYVLSDDSCENDYEDFTNYIHFNYIDLNNNLNVAELAKTTAITRQQA